MSVWPISATGPLKSAQAEYSDLGHLTRTPAVPVPQHGVPMRVAEAAEAGEQTADRSGPQHCSRCPSADRCLVQGDVCRWLRSAWYAQPYTKDSGALCNAGNSPAPGDFPGHLCR